MVQLILNAAAAAVSIACLVFVILIWRGFRSQLKDTKATIGSFSNEVKKLRQEPPKIRTPYEERLKAEYEKRGMKWETTTK